MQSFSDPLARLHEDMRWFARAHEVALVVVHCSGDLRSTVLKMLPMYEFHHDNRSAWLVLEDAHTRADDGWRVRASRLVEHWERRREAFAKDGVALPQASAPPGGSPRDRLPTAVFRDATMAVLAAMRPPLAGLVLAFAPAVIEDGAVFEHELSQLVGAAQLRGARFALVVTERHLVPTNLVQALGPRALLCQCVVDDAGQDDDLRALLASGAGPKAAFGMAAPRDVMPPPRVDDPPPAPAGAKEAALREAGIDPAYLEQAPRLRHHVLAAALAMKNQRGPEAVHEQRKATEIAAALALPQVKLICQITLASYLSGIGRRRQAIEELEDASGWAEAHRLPGGVGQAQLALGLLHALDRNQAAAVRAYANAATAAEQAGEPLLAIEAWRLAGQLALDDGHESAATTSFRKALALAEGSEPDVASRSSAPEAARRLATLCRARGLIAQAQSLDDQADRIEAGRVEESA